jgi:hypothetical protein
MIKKKHQGKPRNNCIKTKNDEEKIPDTNPIKKSNDQENQHSILAKIPLKKRLSVQFYPVEHVQFISNRSGKK